MGLIKLRSKKSKYKRKVDRVEVNEIEARKESKVTDFAKSRK